MERYTNGDEETGKYLVLKNVVECFENEHPIWKITRKECGTNIISGEAINRFFDYEDIGLTPAQLREVDKLYAEKCREVAELKAELVQTEKEKLDEAYDLGYQSCLRYKGIMWSEAEELQRYREQALKGNDELRILNNFIDMMPKTYRNRNSNWVVVQDIILSGTSTAGRTSCIEKCRELGIDPYSHDLKSDEVK